MNKKTLTSLSIFFLTLALFTVPVFATDFDGDGFNSTATGGFDCNDNNATIRPLTNNTINFINSDIVICPNNYSGNLASGGDGFITANTTPLTIDGNNAVTVIGNTTGYGVTTNTNDDVTITGLTINNFSTGIDIDGTSHTSIATTNTITNIVVFGIDVALGVDNVTITDNTISFITVSGGSGILLDQLSEGFTVTGNTIFNVTGGSTSRGIRLVGTDDSNISGNTIYDVSNGIDLATASNNNDFENNLIYNSINALVLSQSDNNRFTTNTLRDSTNGLFADNSDSNNFTGNFVRDNSGFGFNFTNASNSNLIYDNSFTDNGVNAYDEDTNNWNTTLTSGTNIIGGSAIGGNFYSDYTGTTEGNGIGTTTFPITGGSGIDSLPLTNEPTPILITGLARELILIIPILIGLLLIGLLALKLAQENAIEMTELFMLMIIGIIILVVIWGLIQGLIFPTS